MRGLRASSSAPSQHETIALSSEADMTGTVGLFDYIWRNSRREQTRILCVVALSFPFYYFSLDLPKYIISDALQGRAFAAGQETARLLHIALDLPDVLGGPRVVFDGVWLDRLSYLFTLSGIFLLLVLINGLFKYIINMRKGALGERLLQRLRLDLFSALLASNPRRFSASSRPKPRRSSRMRSSRSAASSAMPSSSRSFSAARC
jgi:ABC-type multidrug transport system fused ATPase/permease subunit